MSQTINIHHQSRQTFGFWSAFVSLVMIYGAASSPIPMYALYSQMIGLTHGDLALSSGLYFVGTLVSLLFMARLSDFVGRKKIAILCLLLAIAGCFVFMHLTSSTMLLAGRLFRGLSYGLATSCFGAYLLELGDAQKGSTMIAGAPALGLSLGSFTSAF